MPPDKRSYGLRANARKKKMRDLLVALALGLVAAAVLGAVIWFINWQARP